jgi:REP-associated tyrosine transposase
MQYDTGKHCVFYHRYHIVCSTKYRYKVLTGGLRLRVRDICRQVCRENEVDILRGVLSSDHVHMFVSVPPKLAISDLVRKMKGRSSHKVQREFPAIRKRYWGCRFCLLGHVNRPCQVAGQGLFFNHKRCHHRRHRTSVLG